VREIAPQDSPVIEVPTYIASSTTSAVSCYFVYLQSICESGWSNVANRFVPQPRGWVAGLLLPAIMLLLYGSAGTAFAAPASYPQIGSIWWGEQIYTASPSQASQIQLYLSPGFTASSAAAVKASNPNTKLLISVNAMETVGGAPAVPDSYYLLDVNGNKIANWPGNPANYLLNLTNPAVVQFMAQYAAQQLTQGGFTYDGMFFDNVEMSISTMTQDCYGNPIQINDNYPGPPDAPGALDAKWSAGLYSLLSQFRQLAPNALLSLHANQLPPDPRSLAVANGDAFVFDAVNVREGSMAFGTLYDSYQQWFAQGQAPVITAVQSSPPNQIAYGYGYSPATTALPSTVAFGQNWFPNMRFGLGLTLMNNGYSIYDFGDVSSPVTWWYDEYNFNLGTPVTPATQFGPGAGPNETVNSGFDNNLTPWSLNLTSDGSARATAALDQTNGLNGAPAAHVSVTSAATEAWHVEFQQSGLSVTAGQEYEVQFWARSSVPLNFQIAVQSATSPYPYYGNGMAVSVGTTWAQYSVYFVSPSTAKDGILEFQLGNQVGDLWLDNVQLFAAPTRLYRRDFTNGVVLLNGTPNTQTISLDSGMQRFNGTQAPKYQYIVDDASSSFTTSGSWIVDTFDTGRRVATGPYYHAWQSTLHELDSATGSAKWNLNVPADGYYNLQIWLPAAPAASGWTDKAIYNVASGGQVVATTTLDQSQARAGDQWFTIATDVNLTVAGAPYVSIQNGGSAPLIADAVYVTASKALYNDGSAAPQVTLAPFDSILLQRQTPTQSITFHAPANESLGAPPFTVTATASSGLPVALASNTPSICTMSGSTVTMLALGACSITATQPGNSSYTAAIPVTQTFNVIQGSSQLISFGAISTQGAGTTPLAISAIASSGLAVIFTSKTASVCAVSRNAVTMLAVGTCSIIASQPGNATWSAAPPVTQTFTVVPNLITNGGFETGSLLPWALSVSAGKATAALDSTTEADGATSAHVNVSSAAPSNWQIDFGSARFSLVSGKQYTISFWAKSDVAQTIQVATQGGAPNWSYYGVNTMFSVGTTWARDSLTFKATTTASDTALEFFLGGKASNIWLDDVQVFATGN